MNKLRLREGGVLPYDDTFIVEAFDSTISYLEAIGSGQMWGSQPFSEKEGFVEETAKDVRTSEKYRTTGEGDALRVFLAEVVVEPSAKPPPNSATKPPGPRYWTADDGTCMISVGAVFIRENWLPGHIKSQFQVDAIRTELKGNEGFVYLDVLVTDFRTGHHRKGAGEALVRQAKDYGLKKGMKTLYVDAWAGNGMKLVEFYEKQGFSVVSDFEMKRANGTVWPGTLLRVGLEGFEWDIDSKDNDE
ncbi:kinesin motor domain-containing protein [Colletotrichum incanum]|uniref:Kinesin motor domain-containing protein n=1 Tax=Colletotrichum incanum TaxID=1573173 RepID=A0A162NM61_COLIC|nr:kinesin motor domain-containing protein [Colletotrichum incanum]OHW99917.1 kinesin motor domain-containing protein [Colletotrichum incanum]